MQLPLACFLSLIRPPGISVDDGFLQILPVDKAKCPFVRDHSDITIRLYTRHNPTVYQELMIGDDESLFASNIDFHDPTVLYFSAFLEMPDDGSGLLVRESYMVRGDTNFIIFDLSRLEAGPWYFTAAENTWYIGNFAAKFIDYLVTRGLDLKKTHLIGHSLGAQSAGVAGSVLTTGRVSRITGLDPAFPLFDKLPLSQRLDPSDADFVDVIHTDAGIFGFNRPTGHVDFYPNGGISPQPGCELEVVIPEQRILNKCEGNEVPHGFYLFTLNTNDTAPTLQDKFKVFFKNINELKKINANFEVDEVNEDPNQKSKDNNAEKAGKTIWKNKKHVLEKVVKNTSNRQLDTNNLKNKYISDLIKTEDSSVYVRDKRVSQEDERIHRDNTQYKERNRDEFTKYDNHKAMNGNKEKYDLLQQNKDKINMTKAENEKLPQINKEFTKNDDYKDDENEEYNLKQVNKDQIGIPNDENGDAKSKYAILKDTKAKILNGQTNEPNSQLNKGNKKFTHLIGNIRNDAKAKPMTRNKRFISFFRNNDENFLFRMLEFLMKNRRSVIPVVTVMREINTLVKSANGELNHVSKERNNYIGAPPPTIPISYDLELGNESRITALIKRLLGLGVKGGKLTINGSG